MFLYSIVENFYNVNEASFFLIRHQINHIKYLFISIIQLKKSVVITIDIKERHVFKMKQLGEETAALVLIRQRFISEVTTHTILRSLL